MKLQHRFVDNVPDIMEQGVLYVSFTYCTAMHFCVCGCGNEVVTPISPTDWQLKFDGKSISLSPSIGNWNFDCRSHYWIVKNEIRYSGCWSEEKIARGRLAERVRKDEYYGEDFSKDDKPAASKKKKKKSKFERLRSLCKFFFT